MELLAIFFLCLDALDIAAVLALKYACFLLLNASSFSIIFHFSLSPILSVLVKTLVPVACFPTPEPFFV